MDKPTETFVSEALVAILAASNSASPKHKQKGGD